MGDYEQLGLYDGRPPRVPGSDTSAAAADSVKKTASELHMRVLAEIRRHPATDEELQDCTGLPANTERPRRRELVLMGRIEDSGLRRKTRSGRKATVWRVK